MLSSRIIPARAGFTVSSSPPRAVESDHPRSRGVYITWRETIIRGYGSSPLARGLPQGRCELNTHTGSSPLARGLPDDWQRYRADDRIIPARAGFTCTVSVTRSSWWDHPRSRGVYALCPRDSSPGRGSSPLARGLLVVDESMLIGYRIIPARAGFTRHQLVRTSSPPDHPRSRGVYTSVSLGTVTMAGSSPLARGLRSATRPCARHQRIIPARAGFTRPHRGSPRSPEDHPRSRGVYPVDGL